MAMAYELALALPSHCECRRYLHVVGEQLESTAEALSGKRQTRDRPARGLLHIGSW